MNLSTDSLRNFKGKRVFITGHTGFKGSWLTFLLKELGAEVLGYSLLPNSNPSHFELLNLSSRITSVIGDVRNTQLLNDTLQDFEPEFVFHLAAQALVRPSYEDPLNTYSTNIIGSVSLLEAVRKCDSVRSLVFVTSDKCYENSEWIWGYRETDKLGGKDPYSASKAAAEIIFSSYQESYFSKRSNFGAASVRAGNVIGGGDWAKDRIIPDCIRSIAENKSILLRNPGATRPWQHVLEPISGYLLLATRLYSEPANYRGAWNFGPSTRETKTVRQIADLLVDRIGKGVIIEDIAKDHPHEAILLQLNCDKSNQYLGWYPKWNLNKTLEMTADWYKEQLGGAPVEEITRQQVYEYFPELK